MRHVHIPTTHTTSLSRGLMLAVLLCLALGAAAPVRAAVGDIEWCPAPETYGGVTCLVVGTVQAAVDAAAADGVPGTIYVPAGAFPENVSVPALQDVDFVGNANGMGPTSLNGITFIGTRNFDLTAFTFGTATVSDGRGEVGIYLSTGPVNFTNGSYSRVSVTSHDGAVVLDGVRASNSLTTGISIDNTSGSPGAVIITDTTSTGHALTGLRVISEGNVSLTNVSASKNGLSGLDVDNSAGLGQPVVITSSAGGLNRFEKNGSDGIQIKTNGNVTIADAYANKNGGDGAWVDSAGRIDIYTVNIVRNRFDKNGSQGMGLQALDYISLVDFSASKNAGTGVRARNDSGSGDIMIGSLNCLCNKADKNGLFGLELTTDGSVYVLNISASKNGSTGLDVVLVSGIGNVSITSNNTYVNHFDKNGGDGIDVIGRGPVAIGNSTARQNADFGVQLNTLSGTGTVFVAGGNTYGRFDGNGQAGIDVVSSGEVTLQNLSASDNGKSGLADGVRIVTTADDADMTCVSANDNSDNGLDASLSWATLTLNGVVLIGNDNGNLNLLDTSLVEYPASCP